MSSFKRRLRAPYAGYPLSLILIAGVTALLLWAGVGPGVLHLTQFYLIAILACALVFGIGPAILASVVSIPCVIYFFLAPVHTWVVGSVSDALLLFLILLTSLLTTYLIWLERSLRERAETSAKSERQAREELEALHVVSEAGLSKLDFEDLLQTLLKRLVHGTKSDGASILLLDDTGTYLSTRASYSRTASPLPEDRMLVGESFAGKIAADRQPASTSQTITIPADSTGGTKQVTVSLLGVPLRIQDGIAGVAQVYSLKERQYTPRDVRLLEVIADRVSTAVERMSLYELRDWDNRLLERLIENSPAAIAVVAGSDFQIKKANKVFEQNFGQGSQITGCRLADAVGDRAAGLVEHLDRIYANLPSSKENSITVRLNKDDSPEFWNISTVPLPGPSGKAEGILLVGLNITDQTVARQAVERIERESDSRASQLRTILDSVRDPIFVAGKDGNIIDLNDTALRLLGLKKEDILGPVERVAQILYARNPEGQPLPPGGSPLRLALDGQSFTDMEVLIKPAGSDSDRILSMSGGHVRDESGEVLLAVTVGRDITERRARENDLGAIARASTRLAQSVREGDVLRSITELSVELLDAESSALLLLSPDGNELNLASEFNCRPEALDILKSVPVDSDALTAEAVRTMQVRVVDDREDLPADADLAGRIADAMQYRAAVVAPLISEGKAIGAVAYNISKPRRFTDEDLFLFRSVTSLFGLAVENSLLYQALTHRGQFLESVIDNVPNVVLVYDAKTLRLRLANKLFQVMVSRVADSEAIVSKISDLRTMAKDTGLESILERINRNGLIFSARDFEYNGIDGEQRFWDVNVVSVTGRDGEPGTVIVIVKEDTEQVIAKREMGNLTKTAQENAALVQATNDELVQANLRLQTIIDNMPEGIIISDVLGKVFIGNKKAAEILGGKNAGFPGENYEGDEVGFDTDANPVIPSEHPLTKSMMSGQVLVGEEMRIRRPDGHEAVILANTAPLQDRDGNISGAVSIFQDITKMKHFDQLKDQFVSIASHELRTPLTSIKGYTQLMLRKALQVPDDRRQDTQYLKILDDQADKMTNLVNDLLDLSRIQSGRLDLMPENVDVCDLVSNSIKMVNGTTDRHQIVLEGCDRKVYGYWDPERITQVIVNLLTNAIKYSPAGGEIKVTILPQDDSVELTVQDHGVGIPKESQAHLFERFYRAANVPPRSFGGLGIGLSIAKEIVLMHGGRIWAESEEGQGSTFHVLLPLDQPWSLT